MATIETSIDLHCQLTIHTVTGEMVFDEIVQKVKTYNESGPTKFILWDLTKASTSNITPSQVEAFVVLTQQYASLRKGGKTAIVISSDSGFGLARIYDIQHDIRGSEIPHMSFRSKEPALQWLLG